MEYKIVTGVGFLGYTEKDKPHYAQPEPVKSFEEKVNNMMNEGWLPQGGLILKNSTFAQAMVRQKKEA
jgi:hypothetical protein